ncbi:hypothetical protein PHAVU_005G088436 [Phaseolus vulgaris]
MPGAEKVGVTVCSSQAKPSEWRRWVSLDYSSAIHYPLHYRYIVTFDLISIFFIFAESQLFPRAPRGPLNPALSLLSLEVCSPFVRRTPRVFRSFPSLILLLSFLHFSLGSNCQVQVNPQ